MKWILTKLFHTVLTLWIFAAFGVLAVGLGYATIHYPLSTGAILILALAYWLGEVLFEGKW